MKERSKILHLIGCKFKDQHNKPRLRMMKIFNKICLLLILSNIAVIKSAYCNIIKEDPVCGFDSLPEKDVSVLNRHDTTYRGKIFNVKDYGASGGGLVMDTKAVNAAISDCSKEGDGIVYFPKGKYLCGSIHLKSNITLYLDSGSIIVGAGNHLDAYDAAETNIYDHYQDFGHSHWHNALIWGEGLNNICIAGSGMIEGGGITRSNDVPTGGGDKILSLKLCENVRISGITMKQGGHFAILATGCTGLDIYDVVIRTSRDGIDLMQCSYVNIDNCDILSAHYKEGILTGGDDAIGIKSDYSLGYVLPSHNIYIKNCRLGSGGANGIQFGSETVGNISHVYIFNCEITCAGKSGIGITSNDGSIIEDVSFSNIRMEKVETPFFILISDRLRAGGHPVPGRIKNIRFNQITVSNVYSYAKKRAFASTINGMVDYPVTDIFFNDINIEYKGGGTVAQSEIIPPVPENYSPRYMGIRPAYGFYCRNVDRIEFHNISISYEKPDYRPGLIFKNVDGLLMDKVKIEHQPKIQAMILKK